jgi:hypothetical protein
LSSASDRPGVFPGAARFARLGGPRRGRRAIGLRAGRDAFRAEGLLAFFIVGLLSDQSLELASGAVAARTGRRSAPSGLLQGEPSS